MAINPLSFSREILYIPVDRIRTNPYQPRKFFDRKAIEELAKSIKQYGVIQPISIRLVNNNQFELVAGERRLRATKEAGIQTIPAIIVNIKDKESAIIAMIENLQRQDLNYIEEAEGFINLMDNYSFTQEMLAEKINKSQSTIANKIRLLKLPYKVRSILIEEGFSERHGRALLKLRDEESQIEVLRKVKENDLTVAKTEKLIETMITPIEDEKKKKNKIKYRFRDFKIFENSIKQTVETFKKSGFHTEYGTEEIEDGIEFRIIVKSQSNL